MELNGTLSGDQVGIKLNTFLTMNTTVYLHGNFEEGNVSYTFMKTCLNSFFPD